MVTGPIRVIRKLPNMRHMGDQGHKQLNKKDQERHQIGKGIGADALLKTFSYPIV